MDHRRRSVTIGATHLGLHKSMDGSTYLITVVSANAEPFILLMNNWSFEMLILDVNITRSEEAKAEWFNHTHLFVTDVITICY